MRWSVLAIALLACGRGNVGQPPEKAFQCTAEQCRDVCGFEGDLSTVSPSAPRIAKTVVEKSASDWAVQEVRRGVRPWSDEAIGICRGRKTCDKFLGPDGGKLSRGAYFVRAQLKVPPGPKGMWKVAFRTDCTSPAGETKVFEREYDVVYAGPDEPTELTSLRTIEAPSDEGTQDCKYTLTTMDANGAKTKYTGHWEVAGKE